MFPNHLNNEIINKTDLLLQNHELPIQVSKILKQKKSDLKKKIMAQRQ
jgi:hypothetical protein